jgi:hypothetical protein
MRQPGAALTILWRGNRTLKAQGFFNNLLPKLNFRFVGQPWNRWSAVMNKPVASCDRVETSAALLAESKVQLAQLRTNLRPTNQLVQSSKVCMASFWSMKAERDRLEGFK